ncbi:MAG: hypothetical protein WA737_07445 [Candidatus Acidiferrales bacterium]
MTDARSLTAAVFGAAFLLCWGAVGTETHQLSNDAEETRIQQLEKRLPADSLLRARLEAGNRGDGIHHSWMDDMHREGVKRAWIVIFSDVESNPQVMDAYEVAYYSDYDREGSQITDPARLTRIQDSGLADELKRAATERASGSSWFKHQRVQIPIDLFDDEWLPPVTYEQATEHVQRIAATLPPTSDLRIAVDEGRLGNGIDYAWMDQMRKMGVKRARVFVDIAFEQSGRPAKVGPFRTRYYGSYVSNDSRIRDPDRLKEAQNSGLENALETRARELAAHGAWLEVPRPRPKPFIGGTTVEFLDDGWLPTADAALFTTFRPY